MNNLLAEQIIQDMNNFTSGKALRKSESHYGKQKAITESRKALKKSVMESRKALRKAIEEIGKPLTKLGKLLRKMVILGSPFDTKFATTYVHGFT
jgi:hypothetical protein